MSFFSSRWVRPPRGLRELDPADLAPGFRAAGVAAGIKPGGGLDLGLVGADEARVTSAAALTANAAAAAPIRLCRDHSRLDSLRGIVVNSGNANAATGPEGLGDAADMQERAADTLGVEPEHVAVASTGVIGRFLPMSAVLAGIAAAGRALDPGAGSDFARAIVTTDRSLKHCSVELDGVRLSAQAKGAGMIEPGFATLLAFVQTDAVVPDPEPRLRRAVAGSFERITVDGQMSTNDAIFLQAGGSSGRPLPEGLLEAVLLQLALEVLADGEGATRVARVEVREARSAEEAEIVARAIANSQLVQTGIFGRDPNWGRIVQAAGMALAGEDLQLDADHVDATELGEDGDELDLVLRLGRGRAGAHVFCSDLTPDYVKLNSDYTS